MLSPASYQVTTSTVGLMAILATLAHANFRSHGEGRHHWIQNFCLAVMALSGLSALMFHTLWTLLLYPLCAWIHFKMTFIPDCRVQWGDTLMWVTWFVVIGSLMAPPVCGVKYDPDEDRMEYHRSASFGFQYRTYAARRLNPRDQWTDSEDRGWEYFDEATKKWKAIENRGCFETDDDVPAY